MLTDMLGCSSVESGVDTGSESGRARSHHRKAIDFRNCIPGFLNLQIGNLVTSQAEIKTADFADGRRWLLGFYLRSSVFICG